MTKLRAGILMLAVAALLLVGIAACDGEQLPEVDPLEVVSSYVNGNGQSLVATLVDQLVGVNRSLSIVPESDLIEYIGAAIEWDIGEVEYQDDEAVVTKTAMVSFEASLGQTPKVEIMAAATVPFLFYVRGDEVLRFTVPVELIDLDLDTEITF